MSPNLAQVSYRRPVNAGKSVRMLILSIAIFAWAIFSRALSARPMLAGTAPEIAAAAVLEDHYPAQVVDFPGGVQGFANLVFGAPVGFRPLTLDVYAKATRGAKARPLIVYVH